MTKYKYLNVTKVEFNHLKNCESCDFAIDEMITPIILKSIDLITQHQQMLILQYKYDNSGKDSLQQHSNISADTSVVNWSGSSIELVELIYAMIETKSFNSGNIKIKELLKIFCQTFNCNIKDCYRIYTDIGRRKGSKTIYLNRLKSALKERIDKDLE